MAHFLRELSHDHYRLPWTFILLLAVSLLTLLSLTLTITLHLLHGLSPLLNLSLNSLLALLWTVGFALLTWWSSGTLSHVCNTANWDSGLGISICREYKALFSFSLLGWLGTVLALVLDVNVYRSTNRRGKFSAIQNTDHGHGGYEGKRGYDDGGDVRVVVRGQESNPNPMAKKKAKVSEGYAVPEEQFAYDEDTGYHGAGGQIERSSIEDRI
ncbi:hypothetical protein CC78DRAFT_528823 [Lojkania enalia]|uniref:MARVEL domain-containing protein n=1 Tax=Lojkania enalia TaxID=147567 RepID=A0A9P4TQR1_9PLEO|nr:hypothetical protein CC78DRAFT_528823 [Didymosphaeria enalia]